MASKVVKAGIHSFIIITLSTVFLVSFSFGGSYAVETFYPTEKLYEQGTLVSSIPIGELTTEEAKIRLIEETDKWREAFTVSFHYLDKETTKVGTNLFSFDIDTTLLLAEKDKVTPFVLYVHHQTVEDVIQSLSEGDLWDRVDEELLNEHLQSYAHSLAKDDVKVNIHEFLLDEFKEEDQTIAESYIVNLAPTTHLNELVQKLDGYVINGKTDTSFLALMDELQLSASEAEMSIVASVLYQLLLKTNFEVKERHISETLPEWMELGFEAVIEKDRRDLRFRNPNIVPYTLTMSLHDNVLTASLSGQSLEQTYEIALEEKRTFEPKRIVRYAEDVELGDHHIEQVGKTGFAVTVYQQIFDLNLKKLDKRFVSEDFYRPTHIIEVRSFISAGDGSGGNNVDQGLTNPNVSDDPSENSQQDTENEDPSSDHEWNEDDFEYDESDPIKGY